MPNNEITFASLNLAEPILRAIADAGYTTPTPIQAQAIPQVLAGGDLLAAAQTGTGKTAGFTLPILHHSVDARSAGSEAGPPALPDPGADARTRRAGRGIGARPMANTCRSPRW